MSKIDNESLAEMSVEDLLSLNIEDINEMKFVTLPKGLYGGTLEKWDLPDEDNNNSFVPTVHVTSVIELAGDEPFELPADFKMSPRYGREYQGAIRAMRTEWADFFIKVGGGQMGAAMGNGNGTQIVFKVEHRVVKEKNEDNKVVKGGETKTFAEIKSVQVAS